MMVTALRIPVQEIVPLYHHGTKPYSRAQQSAMRSDGRDAILTDMNSQPTNQPAKLCHPSAVNCPKDRVRSPNLLEPQ